MTATMPNQNRNQKYRASVYCPICTRTVEGDVAQFGKAVRVVPGQKCPRCGSSLDAGYIFSNSRVA